MQNAAKNNHVELYELPFVKIIKLSDDIAEIIVNEGVDYDLDMVRQYHDWVRTHMADPCYILVNRLNSYSYTFEVQQQLDSLKQIKAIALVAYTRISKMSAQAVYKGTRLTPLNCEIFDNREEALHWLEEHMIPAYPLGDYKVAPGVEGIK